MSSALPGGLTVFPASGLSTFAVKASATNTTRVLFQSNNDSHSVVDIGAVGSTNSIFTGSAVGDMFLRVNGNGQRMLFGTTVSPAAPGLTLEAADAGISWAASTSGQVPIKSNLIVFPASGLCTITAKAASGQTARLLFQSNNDSHAAVDIAAAGSTNAIITGSAVGDLCVRINGNAQSMLFSVDSSTIALKIYGTSGLVSAEKTTTSTSETTGALISKGGLGVAENVNIGGDFATQTIGKTLKVKSGSNSKAGAFTLASGAATVSSTAITANSVLVCWLKTASGVITMQPYATAVSVGTSYTVAGGAGDNSTYNYVILEVN